MSECPEPEPREYDPDAFREWQRGPLAKRVAGIVTGGMTDTPEIKRLREQAYPMEVCTTSGAFPGSCPTTFQCEYGCRTKSVGFVTEEQAIQAVRDTETRVRDECESEWKPLSAFTDAAARERTREIVEALRFEDRSAEWQDIADYIESRFLP